MLRIRVHIVTFRRLTQLKACFESLNEASTSNVDIRILLNGHDRESETWLRTLRHPRLIWDAIPSEPRTAARNRAFSESDSEIIYFLDDDVIVPPDLFTHCESIFRNHPEVDVLGGPNLTPEDNSWSQKLFGGVLTSWFAAPIVRWRYAARGSSLRRVDDRELSLCNLALRRRTFERHPIRFVREMRSNEENLFLHECKRHALTVAGSPLVFVFHHRRKTLPAFLQQIASYGFGRAQQLFKAPGSFHLAFGVPALCCLFLIGCLLYPTGTSLLLGLIAAHLLLALSGAMACPSLTRLGWRGILLAAPLTLLLHAAYGFGFWRGLSRQAVEWLRGNRKAYASAILSYLLLG